MTDQPSATPLPKQKWSLGCVLGIAASCILALIVVCLATFILVGLAPDNLPTTTPNPLTPRVVATSTPQVIGSMMVSSEGGQFSKDGLRITIPRGVIAQPGELKISRYNDASSQKDTQDYRSSTYQIEGDFQSIKGEIEIAIALPPEALSPASDQSSSLIVLESEADAPSLGKIRSQFPLASRVDAANNQVVAVLKPGAVASATKSIHGLAASSFQRAELEKIVRVRAENHWIRRSNAQFSVFYYGSAKVSVDRADDLLKILDDQKSRLEKMGFAVGAVPYPIQVNIKDMEDNGGWSCWWFLCEITIKDEFLFAPKDSVQYKELYALVGHEFLHAVQHYESSSRPASMNWMDETAAVWYEPFAVDSADYKPELISAYKDFYRDSMMLAPSKAEEAARRHGYGSSTFLRYLTGKYGNALVPQTFAELKRLKYSSQPIAVLNNVLQANSNTSLSTEWVRFLQTWFTEPAKVGRGGVEPNAFAVAFDAKASGAQYTISSSLKELGAVKEISAQVPFPSFSKLAQGVVMQKTDGTWGALVNYSSALEFQVGDLSGDAAIVTFAINGDGGKVFSSPIDMRIDIDAPENCGVMIFAIRRDNGALVPILGAENYGTGRVSQVLKVSHEGGSGTYKQLTLIAFNRGTAPQGTLKTVRVTMTFLLPLLPTPTPTATPSPTPRPSNTPTRTLTRTLTPTASPIPKTTPTKEPNVLCGCVTKFQTTVLTKQHFDTCKEVNGSKCLGFEVRVTKPWTYNPNTKMCVGSFEYWQSMNFYDPPWARVGNYQDQEVTLDTAQQRCETIGQK